MTTMSGDSSLSNGSRHHSDTTEPTTASSHVGLKREINLFYTTSTMIGVIVGSGIFVSPVSIVQHSGSVAMSLIMWIVSGLICLVITMCYAELSSMFPRAGGEYNFYMRILGRLPAFLYAWINLISYLSVFFAILSLTAAEYIVYIFFSDCHPPKAAIVLVAVWLLVCIVLVNSLYVKFVAKFQTFCTAMKIFGLSLIIFGGVYQLSQGNTRILATGFDDTVTDPASYAIAVYSGTFTYGGWNHVIGLMEEMKEPEKIVPKACIISNLVVICLYLLTNIAYFTVLTPAEMMQSPVVAMSFAEKTYGSFAVVIPFLVALSCIGSMNGALFGGSRVSFAAARDGLFPGVLETISIKYFTPWPSLIILCIIAALYVSTGSAVILIEYVGFLTLLIMTLCMGCLLYVRYKKPDLPRSIKVHVVLVVLGFMFSLCLLLLGLYKDPSQFGLGVILILTGIPAYVIGPLWKNKPAILRRYAAQSTCFIQKLLMVSAPDSQKSDL